MTNEEIYINLQSLIKEVAKHNSELTGDESLREAINLNSMLLLELTVNIEDRFGIIIPDQDLGYSLFSTLNDLMNYVSQKLAQS